MSEVRVVRWRDICKEQARFQLSLIELHVWICRIQLSDWIHQSVRTPGWDFVQTNKPVLFI
jgi:hypothetical protein